MLNSRHEYHPTVVVPPGLTIAETIDALGISQGELAARLGMSLPTVNKIINGKRLTEIFSSGKKKLRSSTTSAQSGTPNPSE
jgi:hypothetical protein